MKFLLAILAFFHLISATPPVQTVKIIPPPTPVLSAWYYPLKNYSKRNSLKKFGEYFSASSYIGKSAIFPNHYLGYHAGSDMEILPGEENITVPVYAVGNGTVIFIGSVSGYGGVILEKLESEPLTVLYGHIKYAASALKISDSVRAGQQLSLLGNTFSAETGGERKHLHLGIYKKPGEYFKGYESDLQSLYSRWLDPVAFLSGHLASEIP